MRVREIYTNEARWNGTVWEMRDIKSTEFDNYGNVKYELDGARGWTPLSPGDSPPDPDALARRKFRPEEMSRRELAENLATMPAVRDGDDEMRRKRNRYLVMYHQKLSLPLTCVVFGTFAIPLGIRPHRTSTSIGLGLSLLFILLYYVLMTVGMILGETGAVAPWVAAWLPNILFGVVGLFLVLEASRK
jgi:lipopolysaccharide export system permease protein